MFAEITMINYRRPLAERAAARKFVGPYRWRPSEPMSGRGFYQASDGLRMDRSGSSFALRLECANNLLPASSRLRHVTGYFCDPDGCGDTLKPIVARLPHGRGFLAGWTMGPGMCAALDAWIHPTEEFAARAAHEAADRDAEDEREAERFRREEEEEEG